MADKFGFVADKKEGATTSFGFVPDPDNTESPDDRGIIYKALGYAEVPRGTIEQALAYAAGISKPDDISRIKKGMSPSGKEYLERAGVSGKSLSDVLPGLYASGAEAENPIRLKPSKGGIADPTLSGTLGLAADVALDPLSYLNKISGILPKSKAATVIETAVAPTATLAKKTAEPLYRAGLVKADAKAIQNGAELLPSKVLFDEGVAGGANKLRKGARMILDRDITNRGALYNVMKDLDSGKIDYSSAKNVLQDFIEHAETKNAAQGILDSINEHAKKGLISPQKLSKSASIWQDLAAKAGAYGAEPKLSAASTGQSLAGGAERNALKVGAEEAMAGGSKSLTDINQRLSALLGGQKGLAALEASEAKKAALLPTAVDSMYGPLAYLISENPETAAKATLFKKAVDLSKTPAFRTNAGMALKNYGGTTIYDQILRNSLANELNK